MAEKLPPRKRLRFRFTSSAGSSAGGEGGGGGDGDGAASPPHTPRRAPSSLPPRSPSPPKPFTYDSDARSRGDGGGGHNPVAGSSGGGGAAGQELSYSPPPLSPSSPGDEIPGEAGREPSYSPPSSDDEDPKDSDDEMSVEHQTRNGLGSLFMSEPQVPSMYSSDPQNPPHYIGRQNCEPLTRQKFLSLHHNWQELLDGNRTYLRPPKSNHVAKDNYDDSLFVNPKPPELALQRQMPLSYLVQAAAIVPTIQQKYKILSEHYVRFRPVRSDGSQFYRAFLFSFLENLQKMQASQAEVTRLMECMRRSRVNFRRLKWNYAYFSNPEEFFSSVVSEFEHLVNSVTGLSADVLYEISLEDISSSRILCLLRLLTEVHIRTHEAEYNKVLSPKNALLFCIESVRPFGAGIETIQIRALSQALGIPVHVAVVDSALKDGTVQVRCQDFIPRSTGSLSPIRQYYLSSATDKDPVLPAGNLFSSDSMPLVTIFMTTADTTAILYRK